MLTLHYFLKYNVRPEQVNFSVSHPGKWLRIHVGERVKYKHRTQIIAAKRPQVRAGNCGRLFDMNHLPVASAAR